MIIQVTRYADSRRKICKNTEIDGTKGETQGRQAQMLERGPAELQSETEETSRDRDTTTKS